MKSLEDMIGDGPEAAEFWQDCQAAFGDPQGQRLLARLCSFVHPLGSPLRGTLEETHVAIGRQEIVAALWRRSQAAIQPSDAPPTQSHGQTTEPTTSTKCLPYADGSKRWWKSPNCLGCEHCESAIPGRRSPPD